MPGTKEWFQPTLNSDGRYQTGFDELGLEISQIDDVALREEARAEMRDIRVELERKTNKDLSGSSDFWRTFSLRLDEKLVLDLSNPIDEIKYYVLISNKFAAPDKYSSEDPQYHQCKWYIHRDEQVETDRARKRRVKDRAVKELYDLYQNPEKLEAVAKYLYGNLIKDGHRVDDMYNMLSDDIENDKKGKVVNEFILANSKTMEQLNYKLLLDEAMRHKLVTVRGGQYLYNREKLGLTKEEVIDTLRDDEHQDILISLRNEVKIAKRGG
mgnify:FL=1